MPDDPPLALSAEQCRGARRLLGWSLNRLSREAGISDTTIREFELANRGAKEGTISVIARALESAGVELVPGGVRLREETSVKEAILPGAERKAS